MNEVKDYQLGLCMKKTPGLNITTVFIRPEKNDIAYSIVSTLVKSGERNDQTHTLRSDWKVKYYRCISIHLTRKKNDVVSLTVSCLESFLALSDPNAK